MFTLLALISVLLMLQSTNAIVDEMTFEELEKDTKIKVVLFHDPSVSKSMETLATMEKLSTNPKFSMYLWKTCTVTEPSCAAGKEKGLTGGMLFTQTPDAGIEQFEGAFNETTFEDFNNFMTMTVTGDKVVSVNSLDGVFAEASKNPIMIKMFEQWCGHCKKMKKHYQFASKDPDSKIGFVEIECSKAGGICDKFGVKGFPTVVYLNKNEDDEWQYLVYDKARTYKALIDFAKAPPSPDDIGYTVYTGPTSGGPPADVDSSSSTSEGSKPKKAKKSKKSKKSKKDEL